MRRVLIYVVVLVIFIPVYFWRQRTMRIDDDGQGFSIGSGSRHHRAPHFHKTGGPVTETLALFGADETNSPEGHVNLSGVPAATWRTTLAGDPTSEHCSSAASGQMKAAMVHRGLFAPDPRVRRTLVESVKAFETESSKGGARPCLEIHGTALSGGTQADVGFFWVDSATVTACAAVTADATGRAL
jgi:hypothetical protein